MKKTFLAILFLVVTLTIAACGATTTPSPTNALTATTQAIVSAPPTATPPPLPTLTDTAIPPTVQPTAKVTWHGIMATPYGSKIATPYVDILDNSVKGKLMQDFDWDWKGVFELGDQYTKQGRKDPPTYEQIAHYVSGNLLTPEKEGLEMAKQMHIILFHTYQNRHQQFLDCDDLVATTCNVFVYIKGDVMTQYDYGTEKVLDVYPSYTGSIVAKVTFDPVENRWKISHLDYYTEHGQFMHGD